MLSEPYKNINNEKQENIKPHGSLRDRYTQCLKDQGIPQNRIKWYLSKWLWNQDLMAQSHINKGAEDEFLDAKAQISDVLSELVDKMRTVIRVRHYSIRTEEAYIEWVCRYAKFLGPGYIQAAGAKEVRSVG